MITDGVLASKLFLLPLCLSLLPHDFVTLLLQSEFYSPPFESGWPAASRRGDAGVALSPKHCAFSNSRSQIALAREQAQANLRGSGGPWREAIISALVLTTLWLITEAYVSPADRSI